MENVFQFQHDAEKLSVGLGVDSTMETRCREIVLFSMISNHFMAEELYDDIHQAPKTLTTMTGDLQKCLSLCTTDLERNYVLLMFRELHDLGTQAIAKYMVFNGTTGEKKEELSLLLQMINLDMKRRAAQEGGKYTTSTALFEKIDLIKKSRYNFDRYMQLSNGETEVDEILNNIFKDGKSEN